MHSSFVTFVSFVACNIIPVPLTVVSACQNRRGQRWDVAIVVGGNHVGGVFWGCVEGDLLWPLLRTLRRRTEVWRGNLFDKSASKSGVITTSIILRQLIFHNKDSVCDPQILVLFALSLFPNSEMQHDKMECWNLVKKSSCSEMVKRVC